MLALALIIADKLGVNVEKKELRAVLVRLCDPAAGSDAVLQGFEKQDLHSLFSESICAEFDFLKQLKEKM